MTRGDRRRGRVHDRVAFMLNAIPAIVLASISCSSAAGSCISTAVRRFPPMIRIAAILVPRTWVAAAPHRTRPRSRAHGPGRRDHMRRRRLDEVSIDEGAAAPSSVRRRRVEVHVRIRDHRDERDLGTGTAGRRDADGAEVARSGRCSRRRSAYRRTLVRSTPVPLAQSSSYRRRGRRGLATAFAVDAAACAMFPVVRFHSVSTYTDRLRPAAGSRPQPDPRSPLATPGSETTSGRPTPSSRSRSPAVAERRVRRDPRRALEHVDTVPGHQPPAPSSSARARTGRGRILVRYDLVCDLGRPSGSLSAIASSSRRCDSTLGRIEATLTTYAAAGSLCLAASLTAEARR